jgi:IQ calmodulin-binding motif
VIESSRVEQASHQASTESQQHYFERKLQDRRKRAFKVLQKFDPGLAQEVVYKSSHKRKKTTHHSRLVGAAVTIQRHYRGHMGRKRYLHLLCKQMGIKEAQARLA